MMRANSFIKRIKEKGIRHIFTHTIPTKIIIYATKFVDWYGKMIYKEKPLQDVIIIESHNDFDSNGGAFYDYLIANRYNKKYKIVWFLRNSCPKNLPENVEGYRYNRPSLKRVYYHCVAKYIVCGHYMIPSLRANQKSYYTTHGAFGLKAFKGNVNIPDEISCVLTPSGYLKDILAEEYCLKANDNRQVILGYPSHDVLYSSKKGDLYKITTEKYKKTILWMPTFRRSIDGRQDGNIDNSLGIPIIKTVEDYNDLNTRLNKENVLLIVKIHPMQDMSTVKLHSLSNIILIDGSSVKKLGIDNYRLMKDVDALISDYSSVAYDYLHLDRPIAYTMDDLETYNVGLIVSNPETLMAGHIIYSFGDFVGFIDEIIECKDVYKEERKILFDKIWEYHDGNSSERLASHMGLIK